MAACGFGVSVTPLPALGVITVVDCMPLASSDKGSNANLVFWWRQLLGMFIMVGCAIQHFRSCLPRLGMHLRHVLLVAFATTATGTALMYVLASVVGFPLPFGQIVGSVAGFPTVLVSLRVLWRNAIRQDSKLRADVHQQLLVFVGQASMTYIFPLYFLAFASLSSYAQSAFTFVLPFIKLGLKNHFGHTLRGIDDIKPAFIVFNVDVFCALFVANCLQRSQSWVNTLLIMIVDIFQICISLYDIHHVMSDIRSLVCLNMFDGSLLNLCVLVKDTDHDSRKSSPRVLSVKKQLVSMCSSSAVIVPSHLTASPSTVSVQQALLAIDLLPASSSGSPKSSIFTTPIVSLSRDGRQK